MLAAVFVISILLCDQIVLDWFSLFYSADKTYPIKQDSPKDGYIPRPCFFKTTGQEWEIGNTCCLIGNLNILGYMHIVSMIITFVPS